MRILVTGTAGFIGSHVSEAYHKAGHEVLGLDDLSTGRRENLDPAVPFVAADLLDEDRLDAVFRDFRPEFINHHAAQVNVRHSWEKPSHDAQVNILGSLTLLRLMVKWKTGKIIYSSSGGAIYGEPERLPVHEDYHVRPLSNYGVSKYTVELYLHSFQASAGLHYVVLRYPNVYGPRQDPKGEAGVVAIFTKQLLQGERPLIFGDGSKTRDYVYVDDIVNANLLALESGREGTFNLGWGEEVTDLEVFEAVCTAIRSRVEPIFDLKRPGEIDHISLDATRAKTILGWQPRIEFREGVTRTGSYWKEKLGVN